MEKAGRDINNGFLPRFLKHLPSGSITQGQGRDHVALSPHSLCSLNSLEQPSRFLHFENQRGRGKPQFFFCGCGAWVSVTSSLPASFPWCGALTATSASSDWRGRHRESEPLDFLPQPPSSLAITNTSRFVWEMAEIIETEFGIKALQATLVERRNKDRLGHIFCNLRLIIVPGGIHKTSSQPAGHPARLLGREGPSLAEAAKEMRRGEGRAL